jgi:protein-S-isoprenylcysteine O-methyltransferase Ste14
MFFILLRILSAVWIVFEVWLIFRDRAHGKGKTERDNGTRYFNIIAIVVGITLAGVLNGRSEFFFPGGRTDEGFWTGLSIMLLGFGLRIWAVATLGASFRTTVETHAEQRVEKRGPYRLVRHPSYSGLLLMCLGYGIAVQNLLSLAFAFILPLIAILYRIRIEEAALISSIGSEYEEYRRSTKKLIPWVW